MEWSQYKHTHASHICWWWRSLFLCLISHLGCIISSWTVYRQRVRVWACMNIYADSLRTRSKENQQTKQNKTKSIKDIFKSSSWAQRMSVFMSKLRLFSPTGIVSTTTTKTQTKIFRWTNEPMLGDKSNIEREKQQQ